MDWKEGVPEVTAIEWRRNGFISRLEQFEQEADSLEQKLGEMATARAKRESACCFVRLWHWLMRTNSKERKVRDELERYTSHFPATRETISALESEQISLISGYLQKEPYADEQYKIAADESAQLALYRKELSSLHDDLANTNSAIESLAGIVEESPDRGKPADELSRWRRFYAGIPLLLHHRDFTGTLAEFSQQGAERITAYLEGMRDVALHTPEQVETFRDYLAGFTQYLHGFLDGLEDRQKQAEQVMAQRVEHILSEIRES